MNGPKIHKTNTTLNSRSQKAQSNWALVLLLCVSANIALGGCVGLVKANSGSGASPTSPAPSTSTSTSKSTSPSTSSSASLSVIPTSIAFGNVAVGVTNTQTVTVSDPGSTNLTITEATVTGTGFRLSGLTLPLTVLPGQSSAFTVAFTPTAATSYAGSLSLTSNASSTPTAIPLSGTGTQAGTNSVNLLWDPSTSTVVGYYVYRGTQAGGALTRLNATPVALASYTDTNLAAGQTLYYEVTAVDASNVESAPSNELMITTP